MHRTLPRCFLLLAISLAGPAAAQIATPNGVALSPFPVLEQPAEYQTFADGTGGIWAVFIGAQSGSGLYAQHVLSDGAYAPGFSFAARAITHRGTSANNLWAAADGGGGAAVIWFGVNPKDSTSQFIALRLTRFDSQGAIPSAFSDTGLVVSSIATAAMVIGDGAGGCYVAWEELEGAPNPDIVAQHYNANGTPLWTPSGSPTGRTVCGVVGIQHLRAIQSDGAGGAYVVWADQRVSTASPLYAMRLQPAGVAGAPWIVNGVLMTPVTAGIRIVGSATTPAGGLWLAWRDLGGPAEVRGQQIESNAATSWGPLGAVIANTTPTHAEFVPASAGDVFVTWGGVDIRCARLSPTGTARWPETAGRLILTPPTSTLNTHAVSDGASGQRLAWSFVNAGQTDVNIVRVDGTGALYPGEPALGDPFANTSAPEEPVAWFAADTSQPVVEWLVGGVLRARRLGGASLGVGPDGPRSLVALAPPAPNPLRAGPMTLRFSAPPGPARLELFDAAGRRLLVRALYASGGNENVSFDDAARLAPGVYTLRLTAAGRSTSQRLVRID